MVERNPLAIAHGIADLLANPPKREDTVAMATRFDWNVNAAKLAEYYEMLLSR